jgi:formylglycine-generating enzyme required for sulfatase activity
MRWIPGGAFTMGTDDPDSMSNERPARRVKVEGFWMDEAAGDQRAVPHVRRGDGIRGDG